MRAVRKQNEHGAMSAAADVAASDVPVAIQLLHEDHFYEHSSSAVFEVYEIRWDL